MAGRSLPRLVLVAAASFVAVGALAGAAASGSQATVTVRVTARDFSFTLSRLSVPAGSRVRFVVRNRGLAPHDLVVAGKRTRILQRGQSQTITVRFRKAGRYQFFCSVPGHKRLGMRGRFSVGRPPAPPPPPPPPVDISDVATLTDVARGLARPVLVTAPPGDAGRIFVVEQTGTVRIVRDGEVLERPFLDLRDRVRVTNESGLLSLAFAPDYEESGRFYVMYNENRGNGDLSISEWRRSPTDPELADPFGERSLLTVVKPWENHNGGMLEFGPDGYLYASIGDGDSGILNPPGYYAQRRDSLLGSIIRIDPRGGDPYAIPPDNPFVGIEDVRPEIWAYGLRNPWRFWVDAVSRDMYIADVGNARREEIDVVPAGQAGLNFGWPCFEGTLPFDETAECPDAVPPVLDIPREGDICSIIGGVVVRDPRLPDLAGRYLFGDFCAGRIVAATLEGGSITSTDQLGLVVPRLTSFGVDAGSRVYATSLGGDVYRIDPKPAG